jgi:hypothetical protein
MSRKCGGKPSKVKKSQHQREERWKRKSHRIRTKFNTMMSNLREVNPKLADLIDSMRKKK